MIGVGAACWHDAWRNRVWLSEVLDQAEGEVSQVSVDGVVYDTYRRHAAIAEKLMHRFK